MLGRDDPQLAQSLPVCEPFLERDRLAVVFEQQGVSENNGPALKCKGDSI